MLSSPAWLSGLMALTCSLYLLNNASSCSFQNCGCLVLSIFLSPEEKEKLLAVMERIREQAKAWERNSNSSRCSSGGAGERSILGRPITHDLITDIFEVFDINVLFVMVHSLVGETYFAKIFLKRGDKILALDSRPSDAIGIALRNRAEIYVNKSLLEVYGREVC